MLMSRNWMTKFANMEILIKVAPSVLTHILEEKFQLTHTEKFGENGIPNQQSPHIKI